MSQGNNNNNNNNNNVPTALSNLDDSIPLNDTPTSPVVKGVGSSITDNRAPVTMGSDFEAQFQRARQLRLQQQSQTQSIQPIMTQDIDPKAGSTDVYRLKDYQKAQLIDCHDDYKSDMKEQEMLYGPQAQKSAPGTSISAINLPKGHVINLPPDDDCTCRDDELLNAPTTSNSSL